MSYQRLIEAFRLRISEDAGLAPKQKGERGFRSMMRRADSAGILPPWWDKDRDPDDCVDCALRSADQSGEVNDIFEAPINAEGFAQAYPQGADYALVLRSFGDAAYGRTAVAQDLGDINEDEVLCCLFFSSFPDTWYSMGPPSPLMSSYLHILELPRAACNSCGLCVFAVRFSWARGGNETKQFH